ncbi:hypothetical protein ACSVDA_12015 [Cytobacillus sp. Hm23]
MFTYTTNKEVFNDRDFLPGTAVHFQTGTVEEGDFKEGNAIVVLSTFLNLEVDLFNIHTYEFERISVPIESYINGKVKLKVLTIEGGDTGSEPTDIYPPGEVLGLYVEHSDTINNFFWTNTSSDYHHIKILRDGIEVSTVNAESFSETEVLSPGTEHTYTFISVDIAGNESNGTEITFTMNELGDTTLNRVEA